MNKDSIQRRLRRDLYEAEHAALDAAVPIASALAVRDWGLGWRVDGTDGGCSCSHNARWYGYAVLSGERITTSDHYRNPVTAADALAETMLKRLLCPHCQRPIATGLAVGCPWRRFGDHWRAGCSSSSTAVLLPIPAPAR